MGCGLNKLSAQKVAKCHEPGYLLDGGGLYLQVAPRTSKKMDAQKLSKTESVTKSWTFRYRDRVTKKLRELGLGPYPDVSLEEARQKASDLRRILRDGKDPKTERTAQKAAARIEQAKVLTFDEAASRCIADRKSGWKNEKHAAQWANTLATYASPIIGNLPVASIDLVLVRKVLDPIWTTKNETASRLRQRLETVLAWATVSGFRTGDNPARWRGHLDQLLPKPSKVQIKTNHAALPYAELPTFLSELHQHQGIATLALEFASMSSPQTSHTS